MPEALRFLPAGADGVLVELPGLAPVLRLVEHLRAHPLPGMGEIIPAARTLWIGFDPRRTTRQALAQAVAGLDLSGEGAAPGRLVEIPLRYDGADLADVAAHLGLSVAEVIARHGAATFTVAFNGFAPGFSYMVCDDPAFDLPRRPNPRAKVPAGSVALAGQFCGIYPAEGPGGWQLIGTTDTAMWDLARRPPARLAPGDRVRFVEAVAYAAPRPAPACPPTPTPGGLQVIRADRPALFQDAGRPGLFDQGVGRSGAMDRGAMAAVNRAVGNPEAAAVVEVLMGGLELCAAEALTLALAGAPCAMTLTPPQGRALPVPAGRAFALDPGDRLSLAAPPCGLRSYLALRGGYAVAPVLGSAATDTLARIGPAPIRAGDVLRPAHARAAAVALDLPAPPALPRAGDLVRLDVLPGPRTDWFTPEAQELLFAQDWDVGASLDRVGIRLQGARPLTRSDSAELASEATVLGAIQVPHAGQPVLFLADHPITGGYPVIGVLAPHHIARAGQIPPGARIRFTRLGTFAGEVILLPSGAPS